MNTERVGRGGCQTKRGKERKTDNKGIFMDNG